MNNHTDLLQRLGIGGSHAGAFAGRWLEGSQGQPTLSSVSPIDGSILGEVRLSTAEDYETVVASSRETFERWRMLPAPKRGELIYDLGAELRRWKSDLGRLVSLEMGKILAEGEGEVQEAIDIADFAVGLSRQLYGKTMHSERPSHRMYEQWHPLGPVGVITAFNFPIAVWAWNAAVAAVCGDTIIWKPSDQTPLTSVALTRICEQVAAAHGFPGVFSLLIDNSAEMGKRLASDPRIPLISATGSCRMGRSVGQAVAARLGRSLLELGGNNAMILCEDASLELAVPAVLFGAVGTAGQRCTSTRRVLIHSSIVDEFCKRLVNAYSQIKIGDPLQQGVLCGPLVNKQAVDAYTAALDDIKKQGGEILFGGRVLEGLPSDFYVEPTIVRAAPDMAIIQEETFAPILYIIAFDTVEEAIAAHNNVPQGLSSAIFTEHLKSAELFLSHRGSDCGIANVNIGTSGAEIGGAFGGEKDTGGGREAGSDSWKAYMRRQTTTINWGDSLPLAQGIKFV